LGIELVSFSKKGTTARILQNFKKIQLSINSKIF